MVRADPLVAVMRDEQSPKKRFPRPATDADFFAKGLDTCIKKKNPNIRQKRTNIFPLFEIHEPPLNPTIIILFNISSLRRSHIGTRNACIMARELNVQTVSDWYETRGGSKMKKICILTLVLGLTVGIAGMANAALITTELGVDRFLMTDTVNLNKYGFGYNYFSWSHQVTPDFTVPFDEVNSASLKIKGYFVFGDIVTTAEDTLILGPLSTGILPVSIYDLQSYFMLGWGPSNGTFDVQLYYNQPRVAFYLNQAILTIDYTNVNSPGGTIPTPEPGTMMLLGSGLVGLAIYGRKKIRK